MKPKLGLYSFQSFSPPTLAFIQENFQVTTLAGRPGDREKFELDFVTAPLQMVNNEHLLNAYKRCGHLVGVISNTTGIDHIDQRFCSKEGIKIFALHDQQEFLETITPTVEFSILLGILIQRNVFRAVRSVYSGAWDRRPFGANKMISRQTVGIVGLGRIGRQVANIYRQMGATVIFYDPYVSGIGKCKELSELMSLSDLISIHCSSTSETAGLINNQTLSYCKEGTFFVNTARGEIVCEDSMIGALTSGRVAGLATDVLSGEFSIDSNSNLANSKLYKYSLSNQDRLIITPHIGGSTRDAWQETEMFVFRRALEYFKGLK